MTPDQSLAVKTATGIDMKLSLAGAGSRSYAFIIDWHVRVAICMVWSLGWIGAIALLELSPSDITKTILVGVIPAVIYVLYHPVVEVVMHGNSPGKRKAGVACVDLNGHPPTTGPILLRNMMRLLDGFPGFYLVGLITVLITKEQVRLGDIVAGTRLIVAEPSDDKALQQLEKIHNASVEPRHAELIQDILERWSSLESEKRRHYALTMLQKAGITPEKKDRALKKQLEALLN